MIAGSAISNDAWILGAGFSHHIHSGIPLTSHLSEDVRDIIVGRFENPLILNNIELALSELRSNAPWKSPDVKHGDMALYERVIERIRDRLQIPYDLIQDNHESLMYRLVNTWHVNQSHVLTLNYDLLVEASSVSVRCINHRDRDDLEHSRFLFPCSIYPIPIPHVRTRDGGTWNLSVERKTFSYYKLHGSLNYYTLHDPFQNQVLYHKHHNEIEDLAEGLQPFIVPPTDVKQTFLEHPVLQTIWAKAAKVLSNPYLGVVIIAGYSMPENDLTVLSMLRNSIRSNHTENGGISPLILVVNPDKDAALRIKKLLGVCNPVGQVTDVTTFFEHYAPLKFVRTHAWDNRHYEDVIEEHRIFQENEVNGMLSEEGRKISREFRDELRERGRIGSEWFLSIEERFDWYQSVWKALPIDRWL